MKKIIVLLLFCSTAAHAVDLAICHRPQVCPAIGADELDSKVTKQGNTFNGPSQLVQLLGNGKLPTLDGSNLFNLSTGTGGSTPAGSDTWVQYNATGVFAADTNFTWDYTNQRLKIRGGTTFVDAAFEVFANTGDNAITVSDNGTATMVIRTDPSGSIINSDGSFNISANNQLSLSAGGSSAIVMNGGGAVQIAGNLESINTVSYTWPSSQGDPGTILTNDGSGILSWSPTVITPGGSDTQFQFNNSGVLDGSSNLTTSGGTINVQAPLHINSGFVLTGASTINEGSPIRSADTNTLLLIENTQGSISIGDSQMVVNSALVYMQSDAATVFTTEPTKFYTSGGTKLGLNGNSAPAFELDVSGDINFTGTMNTNGTPGITAGPFTTITSITVVNGIVTDLQGTP